MSEGFERTLDHLRSLSDSEAQKGRLFERLIKAFFTADPIYKDRFSDAWLWAEWADQNPEFDRLDIGIDLVAEERNGGFCAIQCKFCSKQTRISKRELDSFISASAREPFTARIVVDTGAEWGPNARKTISNLKPACAVLRFGDLADRPINWPDLASGEPEDLALKGERFSLRPHQQDALKAVTDGFEDSDRGKLIMACGTGKTFTALRIAEATAGVGGRALYLVPSISLFVQSMREWATERSVPHRYIGICSDTRAGRNDEDSSLQELEIPVTTDPEAISAALRESHDGAMTVVFCTYHSIRLVEQAQDNGAPDFDLVLCDEAHRTTGIDRPEDKTSPFVLVHNAESIRARKRLYMTATPRLYTEATKAAAGNHAAEVFSMDDEATFGPEFYRLPYSKAVEQNLLSDYKVVVLAMSEERVDGLVHGHLKSGDSEIDIADAAKIVGGWQALQNPENNATRNGHGFRLRRAIAFTNTIAASERLEKFWDDLVGQAIELLPEDQRADAFRCETRHVDGQHHALDRKARIEWLKGTTPGSCRILSNARCLSEGIDVPALDAVLFMSPRNSHVDIVRGVGRAMCKAAGKEYGYIVLPIAVPAGTDPAMILNDNERVASVWGVLRALRSHDDRFNAEINKIDLNKNSSGRIIVIGGHSDGGGFPRPSVLPFPPMDLPPEALFAKAVEKCGDRKYWETWAKDAADIFARLVHRIEGLLANPDSDALRERFGAFQEELRASINDSITRDNAIDMMAQHIVTRPVFEALFEDYNFAAGNPVARALDELHRDFGEFSLENEIRDLERFYESVRMRARGLDNSMARQHVLEELYEKFFATALKKDADRLGIVYTPVAVVDFILNSTNHVLRKEFGRSLSDEGVHVLDPFTGTGTFLVRLLQLGLIRGADLERKYREELHANEIALLAYYIAAVHIEEAYRDRLEPDSAYEPFKGIVLTDTFNLRQDRTGFPRQWLRANSERVERQQASPIHVIVGNPPWSAWQKSLADENPNVDYPQLERRISETYAKRSGATLKNSHYDTYKMAIRWASDRIGDEGVVAFVTDGSWIEGHGDFGMRACLAEEFNSMYILNLRGDQRTQGEQSRREGGNIFGQGSRAPAVITLLVRKHNSNPFGCQIYYCEIGDYLKGEDKLNRLLHVYSVGDVRDWVTIKLDRHYDWIGQRTGGFRELYAIGSKDTKSGRAEDAILGLYSNGYASGRDEYTYNYSFERCADGGNGMVKNYQAALRELKQSTSAFPDVSDIVSLHSSHLRWDRELRNNLMRAKTVEFSQKNIRRVSYRPFVAINCYMDYTLANCKYRVDEMFPEKDSENLVICVPGVGSTKPFSTLMVDHVPDRHLLESCQCFPRYRFSKSNRSKGELINDASDLERRDNIIYTAWWNFERCYVDVSLTKDDIFFFIYGILHAPSYRERFGVDLTKEIPRIPMDPEFHAFSRAGRALANLHLGYETCDEYPLELVTSQPSIPQEDHYRLSNRAMRFQDDSRTVLRINDYLTLRGIPASAHQYQVNGRTPLEWLIDRYKVVRDKHSGILNDPNDWFERPEDLVKAIRRIVWVSVETTKIVDDLPKISGSNYYEYRLVFDIEGEAIRGMNAIANSPYAEEDQAFVDAITDTDWGEWKW